MREQYDFSASVPNPYTEKLRRRVTMWFDEDTIAFFEAQEEATGIPVENLVNLCLSDCVRKEQRLIQ